MTVFHRYLGALIIGLFIVMMVWTLVLRIMGREQAPVGVWATQHWTENLLILQTVTGIVLLLMGYRTTATPDAWLHYLYGSLFPLVAIVAGRITGMRRENREYMGLMWGAFFALALTLRALQTACGESFAAMGRCLGL